LNIAPSPPIAVSSDPSTFANEIDARTQVLEQALLVCSTDRAKSVLFLTGAATDRSLADYRTSLDYLEAGGRDRVLGASDTDCWEGLGCGPLAAMKAWRQAADSLADGLIHLLQYINEWGLAETLKKIGRQTAANIGKGLGIGALIFGGAAALFLAARRSG